MQRRTPVIVLMTLLTAGFATDAVADDPCIGFKWDVRTERGLFAGPATEMAAGKNPRVAPPIGADHLYALKLAPLRTVTFAVEPGRSTPPKGAYGGVLRLKLDQPGNYRVSVDVPVWLDVAADGKLASVVDFQGQHACDAPHKIVEFDLSGARRYDLQVSGTTAARVRLTVTKAPPKT